MSVVAQAGTALIWSPRSNITLYGDTAPVTVRALYEQGSGRWLDAQYDFDVVGG